MLIIRRATTNRLEEISREAAVDLLSHRDANLWLHDMPTEEELHFLKENFAIHHLTIEDIVNQNQRPKIEPFEDYVYLAIHPLRREAKWEIKPSELDLLLGRGPLPGPVARKNPGCAHPGDMNRLLSLKRSIVHIRRAVMPQREVLNQLTRHDFPFVRPENLVYFRDVYDHLIRIAEERRQPERYSLQCARDPFGFYFESAERDDETAHRLRHDLRRDYRDRRHLRHELQIHARVGVALRLFRRSRCHGGDFAWAVFLFQETR